MTITVPIPEKISLNRIYAGTHFSERSRHKDAYYWAVKSTNPKRWTGSYPVQMHYHFRLSGTRLDVSNHAYMLKMTEDALVACGVIIEDDSKYVLQISVSSEKVSKDDQNEVVVELSTGG